VLQKLAEKGFIIEDEAWRSAHLFGIRLPGNVNMDDVKKSLLKHNVYVSFRGNAIRIAPNVYNTEKDFEKLYKALTKAL
jgi:selenocysteine lyase/cysteine desulfurase